METGPVLYTLPKFLAVRVYIGTVDLAHTKKLISSLSLVLFMDTMICYAGNVRLTSMSAQNVGRVKSRGLF